MCTFQHKDDNPLFWLSLELPFRMQSRITEVCNTSGSGFLRPYDLPDPIVWRCFKLEEMFYEISGKSQQENHTKDSEGFREGPFHL